MMFSVKVGLYAAKLEVTTRYSDGELKESYFPQPILFRSDDDAIRTMQEAIKDAPDRKLLAIYFIGEFDSANGKILNAKKRRKVFDYEKKTQSS